MLKKGFEDRWYRDCTFWNNYAPYLFTSAVVEAAEEDIEKICRLLPLKAGSRVLDLGCGVGRHIPPLLRRGMVVIALDQNEAFLAKAQVLASGCPSDGSVEFVCRDFEEPLPANEIDAILILWNTFGYLESEHQDVELLKNARASLRPGGKILIQTIGKEHFSRRMRRGGRDWFEKPAGFELIERRPAKDWSAEETRIVILSEDEKWEAEISTRIYSATEMKRILIAAGFGDVQIYATLDGEPYNSFSGMHSHYEGEIIAIAESSATNTTMKTEPNEKQEQTEEEQTKGSSEDLNTSSVDDARPPEDGNSEQGIPNISARRVLPSVGPRRAGMREGARIHVHSPDNHT